MKLMEIAKDAAEGVYVVGGMDRGRKTPTDFQPFLAEFKKRAGYDAEAVAANCFSSVMLMADAIKRAGSTDPAKIREALAATKDFPMLTGPLGYFNSVGELYSPLEVTQGEERGVRRGRRHRRQSQFWRRRNKRDPSAVNRRCSS